MTELKIEKEVEQKVSNAEIILKESENIKITCFQDYDWAAEELKKIKIKAKELDTERKEMTKPLDESKKRIMDFFRKPIDFLQAAERNIKSTMMKYVAEENRKKRELEEKARIKAKEEERKKTDALEKRAQKAEEKGQEEKAELLREKKEDVIITPHVEISANTIKANGISIKKNWTYKIIDETKIPREYLVVNHKALGGMAKSTKGAINIPGVEFFCEESIAARV